MRVVGARAADRALACEGATLALRFAQDLGLRPRSELRVELVQALPEGLRRDAVGCYATDSGRILALDYAQFLRRHDWLGVPIEPALFRAVVAHEVAHAMAACRASSRPLPTAAHEYFAYVAMFASLPEALRLRIVHQRPACGFDDVAQINDLIYALDPMRFAADAWCHWTRQRAPLPFLRRLLEGTVVDELPGP